MFINSDVIIDPGAHLIIKDVVYLHENSKIIVERGEESTDYGGKLEINGGKLTNSCNGDSWQGIEVWGHSDKTQNAVEQGWLYITNNGCIENAEIGAIANKISTSGEHGFTGGVIRANGGVFINNKTAVKLEDYKGETLSDFYNCTFVTDDNWQIPMASPQSFVELSDYIGATEFVDCKFINKAVSNESAKLKGNGIKSINSYVFVHGLCANNFSPCDEYIGCEFEGLEYGIHATGLDYYNPFILVKNSAFIDNYRGIYLNSFNYAEVISNTFKLSNLRSHESGLYLNQCMGYHVEDNTFYSNEGYSGTNFGIIVNYSVNAANEIYRNNFDTIYCGISVQDENRNSDGTG